MTTTVQNHSQSVETEIALVGHAVISATWEEMQQWRKTSTHLTTQLLRQADEQTLIALAAMDQLRQSQAFVHEDLSLWGLIAAPRYLGRFMMAEALQKFQKEGAWGVSPHLIPHRSLHSVSGTLSQAFGIHGANFGVGGGPTAVAEAMVLAAGLLEEYLPGVLLVMTGLSPDYIPDGNDPPADQLCKAVALAIRPSWGARCGDHLVIAPEEDSIGQPELTLEDLYLTLQSEWVGRKRWRLPYGGTLQLDRWTQQKRWAA